MNTATPNWSLVNSYPFRQPERVFFNPYNLNEIWVTSFGNGLKSGSLSTSSALDSNNNNAPFEAYPNPFDNYILIQNKSQVPINTIKLYTSFGQLLQTQNGESQIISTTELIRGIYFVEIISKDGSRFYQKMIK